MSFRDFVFPYGILMPTGPPHVQWELISPFYKMRKVRFHSAKKDGLRSYRRSPSCLAASHGPFLEQKGKENHTGWAWTACQVPLPSPSPWKGTMTLWCGDCWHSSIKKKIISFNWRLITLQYCGAFCHTLTWISHGCTHVSSSWTPFPLPSHPTPSLWVVPEHWLWVPCFIYRKLALFIYFTYGNIHISMLFSQIIPPLPSLKNTRSLFFISVSLLLSCIYGRSLRSSKFHIYVLIYCIGVSLSDLVHSV